MTHGLDGQGEVVVVGRNCLDHVAVIEAFPAEDTKRPLVLRFMEGGGQAGNAACCVAKLGGRVELVGNLGADHEGRFCLQRLTHFGVHTRYIQVLEGGQTPVAYIFISQNSGKRTIIYEPSRLPPITFSPQLAQLISRAKAVSLAPDVAYLAGPLSQMRGRTAKIIYDCERRLDGLETMQGIADYFIPSSEYFCRQDGIANHGLLKKKILAFESQIRGQLIVTCGPEGAFFPSAGRLYQVPPPYVQVVDTLGAGDNFHAAFALAVARGFELFEAVKLAVAVASLSCAAYGGRNELPDMVHALDVAGKLEARVVT